MNEFEARLFIDQESVEINTWAYEIEPTDGKHRGLAEWAKEHLEMCYDREDFLKQFYLDAEKCWQVIFKGKMKGIYSEYTGEYDEEYEVVEFQVAEVPFDWFCIEKGVENE